MTGCSPEAAASPPVHFSPSRRRADANTANSISTAIINGRTDLLIVAIIYYVREIEEDAS
jgi:hypothetical protein